MTNKEFVVEYQFEETKFGKRPFSMRYFKTKEAAEEFKATTTDGVVIESTLIEF